MGTKNFRNNAFTLVELMIALSIVVILAVIAITIFGGQALKGNDARRKADIDRIKIAVEEYEKDHNCYPQYVSCGVHQSQPVYPYLNNVPCDPTTNVSYLYDYPAGSCPNWFRFFAILQSPTDPSYTPGIGPGGVYNYYSGSDNAPNPIPLAGPTSQSGTGSTVNSIIYYGCIAGSCVPIGWNSAKGTPSCNPSFVDSTCGNGGFCNDPQNRYECIPI